MSFHIYNNPDSLAEGVAEMMVEKISFVLNTKEIFSVALSGGSTPELLYKVLVDQYDEKLPWNRVHFFWGDERHVPVNDPRSNAGNALKSLLEPLKIPKQNIHVVNTTLSPKEAALDYEKLLNQFFSGQPTTFDLILLGMGNDGHTLSIFPYTKLIKSDNWVAASYNEKEKLDRITLLPSIVNLSHTTVFMVQGKSKSAMVKNVISGADYYPAKLIDPVNKNLRWYLDSEASCELNFKKNHF